MNAATLAAASEQSASAPEQSQCFRVQRRLFAAQHSRLPVSPCPAGCDM